MPTPMPSTSSRSSDRLTAFCATPASSGVLRGPATRVGNNTRKRTAARSLLIIPLPHRRQGRASL